MRQVQAVMEKNGRFRRPRHQAAGANGDVNGRLAAWVRRSPKETAALINPHVERGLGRKKRNTRPQAWRRQKMQCQARPNLYASGRTARMDAIVNERKIDVSKMTRLRMSNRIRKGWIRYCRSIEPAKINAAEAMWPARTGPKVHANACTSVISHS